MSDLISRRMLLRIGLGILAMPVGAGGYVAVRTAVRCASHGPTGDGLAALGAAYLRATPQEARADALIARLQEERLAVFHALERGTMQDALAAAQDALTNGEKTLVCDGWVVGRSEARCAALVALDRAHGGAAAIWLPSPSIL